MSPSGSYIKKLVSQRTKYEEQLNSGSEYINATISGMVSYKVDGLEETLTIDGLSNLTEDSLNKLNLKTGAMVPTSEEKGKIVNNYYCYIATVLNSEEGKNAQINDKVDLLLSTGDRIKANIEYISEQSNGKRLIVLKITKCVDKLIDYRKISFEIVWWSADGLKVPNSSNFELFRKTGGENIDEIIMRAIKFKKQGKKLYLYHKGGSDNE